MKWYCMMPELRWHVQAPLQVLHREDSQFTSHFDTLYWGRMLGTCPQEQTGAGMAGAMASSASLQAPAGPRMLDPGAIASSAVPPATILQHDLMVPSVVSTMNASCLAAVINNHNNCCPWPMS